LGRWAGHPEQTPELLETALAWVGSREFINYQPGGWYSNYRHWSNNFDGDLADETNLNRVNPWLIRFPWERKRADRLALLTSAGDDATFELIDWAEDQKHVRMRRFDRSDDNLYSSSAVNFDSFASYSSNRYYFLWRNQTNNAYLRELLESKLILISKALRNGSYPEYLNFNSGVFVKPDGANGPILLESKSGVMIEIFAANQPFFANFPFTVSLWRGDTYSTGDPYIFIPQGLGKKFLTDYENAALDLRSLPRVSDLVNAKKDSSKK
jgi:hypothetical protein